MVDMKRMAGVGIGTALAIAIVAASSSSAHADKDNPFNKNRTDVTFGMLVGGFTVGSVGGPGVGIHLDVGRQMGPLKIYGEYNLLSIGESSTQKTDNVRGTLNRVGVNARYNFAQFSDRRRKLQGAFWVEGGLGRQIVRWHKGGRLTRDDAGFGFGAQMNVRLGDRYARSGKKYKYFGFYYAFKAVIARTPDADKMGMVTCGGPCDEPTGPSPNDYGLFFNLGIQWGK